MALDIKKLNVGNFVRNTSTQKQFYVSYICRDENGDVVGFEINSGSESSGIITRGFFKNYEIEKGEHNEKQL